MAEGLLHRRIYVTGSPMFEVLNYYKEKIMKSHILETLKLKEKEYFIVSAHREENVDNPENLKKIINILNRLADTYQLPVIISTHPRTRKRLEALDSSLITHHPLLHFLKPFGFMDYNSLQLNAKCAISDSGTISEESSMLNFPAVTIRKSMERPEAIDAGSIILTGLDPEIVLDSVRIAIEDHNLQLTDHPSPITHHSLPDNYNVANTSWRILKTIIGTAKLSNKWWGIDS